MFGLEIHDIAASEAFVQTRNTVRADKLGWRQVPDVEFVLPGFQKATLNQSNGVCQLRSRYKYGSSSWAPAFCIPASIAPPISPNVPKRAPRTPDRPVQISNFSGSYWTTLTPVVWVSSKMAVEGAGARLVEHAVNNVHMRRPQTYALFEPAITHPQWLRPIYCLYFTAIPLTDVQVKL